MLGLAAVVDVGVGQRSGEGGMSAHPTTEADFAVRLANRILDQPSRDPDDDLSVLARQMLRWRERAFAPLGDNHHNALLCPHCNPEGRRFG